MATSFTSNLPFPQEPTDSSEKTRKFFDGYYEEGITLSSSEIDATVGFFQSRGFEDSAAQSVAAVLLREAKKENLKVFQLLDTLKALDDLELTNTVKEILNYNRLRISTLGIRLDRSQENEYEIRNILA